MSPRLVLVGGGVRSGKSRFAVNRAMALGSRRLFIATGEARDDEMRARAVAHQAERGDRFRTLEEPFEVVDALAAASDVDTVLIDCVTLWLSNLLLRDEGATDSTILAHVDALCEVMLRRTAHVVVVTNEVGMGVVPESPIGRRFRDLTGAAHQRLAAVSDELYFGVMGVVLRLKPAPVGVASEGAHTAANDGVDGDDP